MKAQLIALLFVLGVSIAQAGPPSVCNTEKQKREAIRHFVVKHYNVSAFAMNFKGSYGDLDLAKRIYGTQDEFKVEFRPFRQLCNGHVRVSDNCEITSTEGMSLSTASSRKKTITCAD